MGTAQPVSCSSAKKAFREHSFWSSALSFHSHAYELQGEEPEFPATEQPGLGELTPSARVWRSQSKEADIPPSSCEWQQTSWMLRYPEGEALPAGLSYREGSTLLASTSTSSPHSLPIIAQRWFSAMSKFSWQELDPQVSLMQSGPHSTLWVPITNLLRRDQRLCDWLLLGQSLSVYSPHPPLPTKHPYSMQCLPHKHPGRGVWAHPCTP